MRKSSLSVIFTVAWLVLVMIGPAPAETGKVGQVIYITRSKVCGCSAKSFHNADALVSQTFTGPRQALLKRIDYDTDRQAAVPYIGEYRLVQLPALLFLDAEKHLLWMKAGELGEPEISAQLSKFGM